jgi:plasmid stabilization system protein ParE
LWRAKVYILDAAKRAVKTIRESVRIIASQPNIGRPAEDMTPEGLLISVMTGISRYIVTMGKPPSFSRCVTSGKPGIEPLAA